MCLETALKPNLPENKRKDPKAQLEAVGKLTEANTAMQEEMDDYLSIFKRHDLTKKRQRTYRT